MFKSIAFLVACANAKTWNVTADATWTVMYNATSSMFDWSASVKDASEFYLFTDANGNATKTDNIKFNTTGAGQLDDMYGTWTQNYKDGTQNLMNPKIMKPSAAGGNWSFSWSMAPKAAEANDQDLPCTGSPKQMSWYNGKTKTSGAWTWEADSKCVVKEDAPAKGDTSTTGSITTLAATTLTMGALLASLF